MRWPLLPMVRTLALSATCLMALAAPPAVHAQTPFDEGIVELVAERLPPITLVVRVDAAGRVLLPMLPVLEHLGFQAHGPAGTILVPQVSGGAAMVDAARSVVIAGRDTAAVGPGEISTDGDMVFLAAERFGRLLGAQLTFDPATLTVTLRRQPPFPAQQRILAEERRAMMQATNRHAARHDRVGHVPYRAVTGAGIVDWEIASQGLDPLRLTTVRTQAGSALFGGDLTGSVTVEAGRDAVHSVRNPAVRYHRVFPGNSVLSQFRAGDIISSGIFARFIEGVEIGNRPFIRETELGAVMLKPDLPAGWDYEVFQGNQLLGYSERGTHEAVSVPLRAGSTPVQVRMYGPAGEEVVSTLLYQTPVSLLRDGAVEYAAAVGRCEARTCARFAHADVRYGASSRLTVGGGMEYHRDSLGTTVRPYAVSSFTSGVRVTGEVQVMPGATYGTHLSLFPREGSVANLRASIASPGFGPVSLIPDERSRWDVEASWDERFDRSGATPFHGMRVTGGAGGSRVHGLERWRLAAIGSLRMGYAELRYDNEGAARQPHTLSARTAVFTPFSFGRRALRPMLTGGLGAGQNGLRLAEFGAAVQPASGAVLSATVQWIRGSSEPSLAVAWNSKLGPVQSAFRTVTGRTGASAAMISGSTAVASRGSITTTPTAGTGYAGVHGTVFIDNDGDGVFSSGDELLPDAALIVGGLTATTDRNGRYRIWGLQPYAPATVAVDSTRIADPSLVAVEPLLLRPVPNTASRTDVPLVRTREVAGSLAAGPGVPTLAGVSVELRRVGSDELIRATTFSDGQFYVSRVRPGRYRLAVAPSSLAALGALGQLPYVEVLIPASGDLLLELPPLRLEAIR